jgi:hypothetical protein
MAGAKSTLEQMTAQLAEINANVKTSRQLLELLKFSSNTKGHTKAMIADLAKLYRCIHLGSGKVLWISGDKDALDTAAELGFLVDLTLGRSQSLEMSDAESAPLQSWRELLDQVCDCCKHGLDIGAQIFTRCRRSLR